MRNFVLKLALVACLGLTLLITGVGRGTAEPQFGLSGPDVNGAAPWGPTGAPKLGVDAPVPEEPPGAGSRVPAESKLAQEKPEPKAAPPRKAPPTQKEMLDILFGRLAKTKDPAEAGGIVDIIQHEWLRSGSDTADLLMARALTAMSGERRDVALALLDKIILLRPDWAEAWNRRATLRFLADDDNGSMEDIGHVLVLEPRHFGALSGMGFILQRHGMGKQALSALRKVLDIYPEDLDIRKVVDQLTLEVEGRDL